MNAFPAFFPLTGRCVVIAGAGEAAEAKARLFEGSPARVERLTGPAATATAAYRGAVLAFVADADPAFVEAAARAAREAGVPVNVVDRPALCDFTAPAVVDRGEVVIAIGTGGASPMLAAMLRNDIEARVPLGAGHVASLFRRIQDAVRTALPDPADRRDFLRDLMEGPAARAATSGDLDEARRLVDEALAACVANGRPRIGRVSVVLAGGPVELLSLRASRLLNQADVLLVDPAANPEVAALARRDARRIVADDQAVATVLALVDQGQHVVWAAIGQPPTLEETLANASVSLEVLAPAPTAAELKPGQ